MTGSVTSVALGDRASIIFQLAQTHVSFCSHAVLCFKMIADVTVNSHDGCSVGRLFQRY